MELIKDERILRDHMRSLTEMVNKLVAGNEENDTRRRAPVTPAEGETEEDWLFPN